MIIEIITASKEIIKNTWQHHEIIINVLNTA